MIQDLFNTRFGFASLIIFFNDVSIPDNFVNDFVSKIEINTSLLNPLVHLYMIVDDKFVTQTIEKSVQELSHDDSIRIIIEDKDHDIMDRRFVFSQSKDLGSAPLQGNQYLLVFLDIYSYVLTVPEFSKYITAHGYSGTPLDITKQALTDAFTPVVEINKTRKEKTIELNVKKFKTKMPDDKPIYEHFAMDKIIYRNLSEIISMYNIYLFQDFNKINLWQNISCDQLEQIDDKDGTELYSEETSQLYANLICDRIKMPGGGDTLGRTNIKAFKIINGIHHEEQHLEFDDFLPMITMNNNADTYRNLRASLDTSSSSRHDTLGFLTKKSFYKYINNNTLIIFVRPFFKNIKVGTKVSVRTHANTEFQGDQMEGDLEYNGVWLITQSTICIIGQHFVGRLVLRRFDNMKRNKSSSNSNSESHNDETTFSINKPINAKTGTLDDASRFNLDDDLKKDVEERIAKVGTNANSGWNTKTASASGFKDESIYRIKESKDGLLSTVKKARQVYLEGKKEALLQVQRIKNGIDEATQTVRDIKDSINSVKNAVEGVKQEVNAVKNEVKRFKNFANIKNLKEMVKQEGQILKGVALSETANSINYKLGTNITPYELEYMIKNKTFSPILERELSDYTNEFTQLSHSVDELKKEVKK